MSLRATDTLFDDDVENSGDPFKYVRRNKRFDCERMPLCLDVAAILGWPGFSCKMCSGEGPDDLLLGIVYKIIYHTTLSGNSSGLLCGPENIMFNTYRIPR